MQKKYIVLGVVGALIIAGVSFYGGTAYAKRNSNPMMGGGNFPAGMQQGGGRQTGQLGNGAARAGMGGGFTAGEILSKDETTMTIKLPDGGSKIVLLGQSTQVTKSASGTTTDLVVGTQVTVTGTTNSDGSVTAQSVQIRPAGMAQPMINR